MTWWFKVSHNCSFVQNFLIYWSNFLQIKFVVLLWALQNPFNILHQLGASATKTATRYCLKNQSFDSRSSKLLPLGHTASRHIWYSAHQNFSTITMSTPMTYRQWYSTFPGLFPSTMNHTGIADLYARPGNLTIASRRTSDRWSWN